MESQKSINLSLRNPTAVDEANGDNNRRGKFHLDWSDPGDENYPLGAKLLIYLWLLNNPATLSIINYDSVFKLSTKTSWALYSMISLIDLLKSCEKGNKGDDGIYQL